MLYGLAPQGWMLYPVLLATVLQYITEPCIQGLMATLVGADRQGSLQVRAFDWQRRVAKNGLEAALWAEVGGSKGAQI